VPIEEVAGTVKDLIREGMVKHFGLRSRVGYHVLHHGVRKPLTGLVAENVRSPEGGAP